MTNFQGSVSSKVPKHSQIDLNILKRMEEVKELLKVDRVHVYEFHNGGHYVNGYSALKVSYTYEVEFVLFSICYIFFIPLDKKYIKILFLWEMHIIFGNKVVYDH